MSTNQIETRSMQIDPKDQKDDDELNLSFSSQFPFERRWGLEVLDHSKPENVDLSRLNSQAPFLWNHDPDKVLGVVKSARIDPKTKRGLATIRWSSRPDVQPFKDDVKNGILRNVSTRYSLGKVDKQPNGDMLVTQWSPIELSLVSIPVDPTVGVNRVYETDYLEEIRLEERQRILAIRDLGNRLGKEKEANRLILSGASLVEAREYFLERVVPLTINSNNKKGITRMSYTDDNTVRGVGSLGLSEKEQKSYSILKAIKAFCDKDWSDAGLEQECSRTIAQLTRNDPKGFFVPMGDLRIEGQQKRDLTPYITTTANAAGNLIQTTLDASNFIDLLRNKIIVASLGAKFLTGLIGNLNIPRRSAASTAYWVSDGSAVTESEGTFDLVQLRPKNVGAYASYTRQMILQSTPDIEMLVRDDLAKVIALEIDRAAIAGTGSSGQPTGILNTSGIGSVALGTNGAAVTIQAMIGLETAVAAANADFGNLGYVTNAKVIGGLKSLVSTTGQFLWIGGLTGLADGNAATPISFNGYPMGRSNQVPNNLTKGSGTGLSAAIFGNWGNLFIGNWGVLDLLPNPYGAGYSAGTIEVRALQTVDVAVAHPQSFAAITDIAA